MKTAQLDQIIGLLGQDYQVFRIIQLDRRTWHAHIPPATIAWSATIELIMKGSNTDLEELPLS